MLSYHAFVGMKYISNDGTLSDGLHAQMMRWMSINQLKRKIVAATGNIEPHDIDCSCLEWFAVHLSNMEQKKLAKHFNMVDN
jgi:hypothetical protein